MVKVFVVRTYTRTTLEVLARKVAAQLAVVTQCCMWKMVDITGQVAQ